MNIHKLKEKFLGKKFQSSPLRGLTSYDAPWEGNCSIKPWEYEVTAVVPVLDTVEPLKICVEILRLQSIKPFIIVVDTGSTKAAYKAIKKMQAEDLEVHSLSLNGVLHPSDYPAMAMDLAFSVCRSEFLFATHADCFLRKRDFLEQLLNLCKTVSPAVGYELTKRNHKDWKGMLSHTASMYHMPTMDKIGFGWSQRRLCNLYGIKDQKPNPLTPNWPDTEILGNYILRQNNIVPHLVGTEQNLERNKDENIDHVRSYTSGMLYSVDYFKAASKWYEDAKREAYERINKWKKLDKQQTK